MAGIYNQDFKKVVEDGASGNQAMKGLFYRDQRGLIRRLTEAEGHEISYNPETVERNPIGQEAPEDEIRSYRDTFGKDIIIKKGAKNYEFFKNWLNSRPTGDNAKLELFIVDFMDEEIGANHNKYLTYSYMATVTVDSGNYTDGTLTVNFSQAGDRTIGIMGRTDTSVSDDPETFIYGFTPSSKIVISSIDASVSTLTMQVGDEKWVEISFSPLGCPYDFLVETDDEGVAVAERRRQSVIIRGRGTGTADITVTSTTNSGVDTVISVTVA